MRIASFAIGLILLPAVSAWAQTIEINDDDQNIIYSRDDSCPTCSSTLQLNWGVQGVAGDYSGDEHYSNVARDPSPGTQVYGASAVVNFYGTGITWIGRTGPEFGMAAYSVDGGPVTCCFDAYTQYEQYQQENVIIVGLDPGSHSLKIEVTPYKNDAATDYYQVIDAFVITGGNTIAPSDGFGAPDMLPGHASPSDVWYCGAGASPNASDLSGKHCYQTQPAAAGSYFWWSCNSGCSLIEVYGRPDAEDGFADVYIDWNYVTTIDWVYGTIDDDLINAYNIFTWRGPPGIHNITLIATGTTDSTISNAAFLQVDTIMAFP
jgi:hypothetical protein